MLSGELLARIVNELADTYDGTLDLLSLCLVDRAFTTLCQEKIFEIFTCTTGREPHWIEVLEDFQEALKMNPRASGWVREIRVEVYGLRPIKKSPLYHPKFISLLELLSRSARPPQRLFLDSSAKRKRLFDKPDLVLDVLERSLSSSLTNLCLQRCSGVPLALFHVLPSMKTLSLNEVSPLPGELELGLAHLGSPPYITDFEYVNSCRFIEAILERRHEGAELWIDWSKLRCLTLCPAATAELAPVQAILNQAGRSLETLSLTNVQCTSKDGYVSLPEFVDLQPLVSLKTLEAFIDVTFDNDASMKAAEDLAQVLTGINSRNTLSFILLQFHVIGVYPFVELRNQKWRCLIDQLLRVAGGEPFELDMSISIMHPDSHSDQEVEWCRDLHTFLQEQMVSLWNVPTIKVTFNMYPPPPTDVVIDL